MRGERERETNKANILCDMHLVSVILFVPNNAINISAQQLYLPAQIPFVFGFLLLLLFFLCSSQPLSTNFSASLTISLDLIFLFGGFELKHSVWKTARARKLAGVGIFFVLFFFRVKFTSLRFIHDVDAEMRKRFVGITQRKKKKKKEEEAKFLCRKISSLKCSLEKEQHSP